MKFFSPHTPTTAPVDNSDDVIIVQPNDRGGWSLCFPGDAPIGNYPTSADAEQVARLNVTHVRVIGRPSPEAA